MRRPSSLEHDSVPVSAPVVSEGTQDQASRNCSLLHPGQIFVSTDKQSIAIILGSCVAVCVWDSVNGIGGATHFMLPTWDEKGMPSPRYGSVAISLLLQKLVQAGAVRGHLRAKIFGGGCLFDSMRESSSNKEQHLGSRNVDIALEILAKAHIPVVSREVGGDRGQRIVFRTDTGGSSTKFL